MRTSQRPVISKIATRHSGLLSSNIRPIVIDIDNLDDKVQCVSHSHSAKQTQLEPVARQNLPPPAKAGSAMQAEQCNGAVHSPDVELPDSSRNHIDHEELNIESIEPSHSSNHPSSSARRGSLCSSVE